MKCFTRVTCRFLVAATLVFAASVTTAQGADEASLRVAEVDLGRLFKNDEAFQAAIEAVKASALAFEQKSRASQAEIMRMSDKLKSTSEDERPDLEAKLELAVRKQNAQNEKHRETLFEQESLAYRDAFVRISNVIATFAKENGFAAVRRNGKNRKPRIPKGDRKSIVTAVNSPYLYIDSQSTAVDITDKLLGQIE